jgi:transcriptional regulator with XRE-family HTH domain
MTIKSNKDIENIKKDLLKDIGSKIKVLRESKGFTQVQLVGEIMGDIDTTNISRIEAGRTNPTVFTLYRIAEALEVSLSDIVDIKLPSE